MLFRSPLVSLLAATSVAGAFGWANSTIRWHPCNETTQSPLPVDCGRLEVPLDYTKADSSPKLGLELLRVPAVTKPAKGSILLNFGGPGLEARETLRKLGPVLQALTGGVHDLIVFDPRGTGRTIPVTCYDHAYTMQSFYEDPIAPNEPDDAPLGKLWARGTIVSKLCQQHLNETGRMLGTPFVARDIVSVVDALNEDGLIRYWGFSYGTTLGATLVSMFHDKVDKVILDGVQNPHEYYNALTDLEEWLQTDEVFSAIFRACAENPDECALARPGKSATDLENAAWKLFETLKRRPIPVGTVTLDENLLRRFTVSALYTTKLWKNYTSVLEIVQSGNIDEQRLQELIGGKALQGVSDKALDDLMKRTAADVSGFYSIHCLDRARRAGSLDELMPSIYRLFEQSRLVGGTASLSTVTCAQWKLNPPERYTGDFKVRTRQPVLIVENTYDALTPMASARNVSAGFEGSVVLEINGIGHTSLNLPSSCALKAVSRYWRNGTLPAPGTVCEAEAVPFSNVTWADVIADAEDKDLRKRSADLGEPVLFRPWTLA